MWWIGLQNISRLHNNHIAFVGTVFHLLTTCGNTTYLTISIGKLVVFRYSLLREISSRFINITMIRMNIFCPNVMSWGSNSEAPYWENQWSFTSARQQVNHGPRQLPNLPIVRHLDAVWRYSPQLNYTVLLQKSVSKISPQIICQNTIKNGIATGCSSGKPLFKIWQIHSDAQANNEQTTSQNTWQNKTQPLTFCTLHFSCLSKCQTADQRWTGKQCTRVSKEEMDNSIYKSS